MFLVSYILFASLALGLAFHLGDTEAEWEKFQAKFDKHYRNNKELLLRKQIFAHNLEAILQHNAEYEAGRSSYKLGVNEFTDRTQEEWQSSLGLAPPTPSELLEYGTHQVDVFAISNVNIPDSIDYRKLGAVTPVKNQKKCGSCWAFAAVGSIEGVYFLKTKKLISFSEQQLVDCSRRNSGCDGGLMSKAFKDLKKMGGIVANQSYPYKAAQDKCKYDQKTAIARINGYKSFKNSNTTGLLKALALYGPISIAIETTLEFMSYDEGILSDDECSGKVDHAVLLVGYGSENGRDYWIVKNSWGTHWGENGYFRLDRSQNNCIQPKYATVPIVKPI